MVLFDRRYSFRLVEALEGNHDRRCRTTMTDFQKRISKLVAALPDGDKHGRYARFCRDVERVTGAK
ncbi:MAG TPA: hypothetical protein PLD93_02770, partial [Synergistaceae bacterium]|nr:hypothetical protein [Synergistaceae bacterium]